MSKKTILLLFPRFGIGGIAKAMSFVANVCCEQGYDVYCVSMSDEEQTITLNRSAKKEYCKYNPTGYVIEKTLYLFKLRRVIRKISPHLIISFGTTLIRIVSLSTIGLNIKMIGSERGNPYVYSQSQAKKYVKHLNKCFKVVFQTEGARQYYPDYIQKKSVIIPNPAVQRFNTVLTECNERSKRIIICSRLSPEKQIDGIIEAFSMSEKLKKDFVLNIYGTGPEESKIKEIIKRKGLSGCVFLLGNVRNVFEIERNAALYVLFSEFEGMPNSLIEAMGVGIPCVASDCPPGGVSFITGNGSRAKLVGKDDILGLSKAMEEICFDKKTSEYYAIKGLEINTVLSPELIKQQWISLINDILHE